jgi:uncharacterized coiled-coil protein SlyX
MASDIIHNSGDGPVFDLGVDLDDRHGIAYIRVTDVEEMARVLGMATRDEVQALNRRIEELNAEVTNVPREVEKLKDGLSDLVSDFLDRVVPRGDSIPSFEKSEDDESDGNSADDSIGQDGSDAIDKGPDELSGRTGDEFGFGKL